MTNSTHARPALVSALRDAADRSDLGLRPGCAIPAALVDSLAEAVAAGCPVALTNDSGLLHVAEACGAAVVAVFGPTHPRLGFAPLDARSRVVHSGIACSPCDPHGPERCPRGHHRCMTDIEVDRVMGEIATASRAAGERR